jgi:hypothetical protein
MPRAVVRRIGLASTEVLIIVSTLSRTAPPRYWGRTCRRQCLGYYLIRSYLPRKCSGCSGEQQPVVGPESLHAQLRGKAEGVLGRIGATTLSREGNSSIHNPRLPTAPYKRWEESRHPSFGNMLPYLCLAHRIRGRIEEVPFGYFCVLERFLSLCDFIRTQ